MALIANDITVARSAERHHAALNTSEGIIDERGTEGNETSALQEPEGRSARLEATPKNKNCSGNRHGSTTADNITEISREEGSIVLLSLLWLFPMTTPGLVLASQSSYLIGPSTPCDYVLDSCSITDGWNIWDPIRTPGDKGAEELYTAPTRLPCPSSVTCLSANRSGSV